MKNTILKTAVCAALVVVGTSVFAGDHHRGPDHHENSGVRLATDIVNLVGSSLNLLRPTAVVYTEPAYCPPPVPPSPRHHHHHHCEPPKPRHHDHGHRR